MKVDGDVKILQLVGRLKLGWHFAGFLAIFFGLSQSVQADSLDLLSKSTPVLPAPATAGGDSGVPIISPNGRFIVFASLANNLTTNGIGTPFQVPADPCLNVYLKDRVANSMVLVSVSTNGISGGDKSSFPTGVTADGRFVLFESYADNLTTNPVTKYSSIFLRDMAAGVTTLVSVNTNGSEANGHSHSSTMTPDGRYVAFTSAATDLNPADTNNIPDIYLRDLQNGTTALVSIGNPANISGGAAIQTDAPRITDDGRYVAYYAAPATISGLSYGEIYIRDMAGTNTIWASSQARTLYNANVGTTNATPCDPNITPDGRFVCFQALSGATTAGQFRGMVLRYSVGTGTTDLIHTNSESPTGALEDFQSLSMTPDGRFIAFAGNVTGTNGTNTEVYVWDANSGSNTPVSVNTNGVVSPIAAQSFAPTLSSNGQFVAFVSTATDLVTNKVTAGYHLYFRDLLAGITSLIDVDTNGLGSGVDFADQPALSADGQTIAYESRLGNLVAGDRNHDYDIFVWTPTGRTNELVSASSPSLISSSANGFVKFSKYCSDRSGRYVAFSSDADDLVAGDTNQVRDVFVRDLLSGSVNLISIGTNGAFANGPSWDPSMSDNGRFTAFTSLASNLLALDTNNGSDVFIRDTQTQTTILVSHATNGIGTANNSSYLSTISSDGRFVLYASRALNLAAAAYPPFNTKPNLFLYDRFSGTNYVLTTNGYSGSSMTRDGKYVAFSTSSGSNIFVWDSAAGRQIETNSVGASIIALSMSPDSGRIAYFTGTSSSPALAVLTRSSHSIASIGAEYPGYPPGLNFSADSRFLAYASSGTSASNSQIHLYDTILNTNILVSHAFSSLTTVAGGTSDSPDISPDGRFIAYRSTATNLVPGFTNGFSQIVLYDAQTGLNTVLTEGIYGTGAANNRSFSPVFSADGQILYFNSFSSNLTGGDYNLNGDVFAYAFLYATLGFSNGTNLSISWPANSNGVYSVQYKNSLADPSWTPLPGTVRINGNKAFLSDSTSNGQQRYYRIVSGH